MPKHASRLLAALLVLLAALVASAPAVASDASLRTAVIAQEKKLAAVEKDFEEDTDDTFSAVGREDARLVAARLKSALTRARSTVTDRSASSTRRKRARTAYLDALADGLTGVRIFQRGLIVFDPDSPAKSRELVKRGEAQLAGATTRRLKAAKVLRAR